MRANMREHPDLRIAGFSLWILGRQYPVETDYWDGNWLNVMVHVEANQAVVRASGPIVHLSELERFSHELRQLVSTLSGTASLLCIEPTLKAKIGLNMLGQGTLEVSITPDHLVQRHKFIFQVDQTYLTPLLGQCAKILSKYEIRGSPLKR